ncbi:protein Hook homolog 3-like isoform X2 [Babylonia areolata]|uniref:protein Hook homolog 3-like isoform X2 n=1 Tax=Babylonia areolata TaxID=304850 RepID=UPI003FD08005
MEPDREQICYSLISWLQTFELDAPHDSPADLSDGIAIAQALQQIAPEYFSQTWMNKIKTEDVGNWRLKVTNLKKIVKGILEYNLEVLGVQIQGFQMPDFNAIGEYNDPVEVGRLLQLVLGVAVNCENKQDHIQRIMGMGESVQQTIKNAIQELMNKETSTGDEIDTELHDQLKKTVEELNAALEAKEELMQRCHELDMQVTSLQEEKTSLTAENDRLQDRLQQAENVDDPSTPAGKRLSHYQQQIDTLQEEIYKLESGKDDYRIKYDVLFKDHNELKEKNLELTQLASEARAMKDELDILRHVSDQVAKYEATIESYKKKLEEMSDLRVQLKMLEEKNTSYMQQQIEMEEDLKRLATIKQQLESYKRQTLELQNRLTDETKRADKWEFEFNRVQEKFAVQQREKERVMAERDSLKEMNEELKCTQATMPGMSIGDQMGEVGSGSSSSTSSQRMEMLSVPPEIKEQLLRLEHENKMLKMGTSGTQNEESEVLQSQLDDSNARNNELQTEVRLLNQRLLETQAQVEDLQEKQQTTATASSNEVLEMKKRITEQTQKLEEKELQLAQRSAQMDQVKSELSSTTEKMTALQERLARKDEEMKAMEERYTRYLEKAKNVIQSLDMNQTLETSPELVSLRHQLLEKDQYINHIEKEHERMRAVHDEEERLIVTAWYNLGMQLHRQAAEERLANNNMGQSFLARQRQVHSARRAQTINTLHSSNANRYCQDLNHRP